jgi:hypothetical protein
MYLEKRQLCRHKGFYLKSQNCGRMTQRIRVKSVQEFLPRRANRVPVKGANRVLLWYFSITAQHPINIHLHQTKSLSAKHTWLAKFYKGKFTILMTNRGISKSNDLTALFFYWNQVTHQHIQKIPSQHWSKDEIMLPMTLKWFYLQYENSYLFRYDLLMSSKRQNHGPCKG